MTIQITIIGLGQIGASVGLALRDHTDLVRRVGNDREPRTAQQAEKMGALDQVSYNLPSAVRQADVVFLAEPLPQSRETLQTIALDLKPGAVVIDTAPAKVSNAAFAAQTLPAERHYVALTPTLNPAYLEDAAQGIEAAHADLFKNSLMVITAPPGTHAEAIKLVSDLVGLLEARPLFGDPYELDGLLAASQTLPQLTAAALLNATTHQPGWRENRKVAGRAYARGTRPILDADGPQALAQSALQNPENVARVLADLMNELDELRAALVSGDEARLVELLEQAAQERANWLQQRLEAEWESEKYPPPDSALVGGQWIGRLIGIGKKPGKQK